MFSDQKAASFSLDLHLPQVCLLTKRMKNKTGRLVVSDAKTLRTMGYSLAREVLNFSRLWAMALPLWFRHDLRLVGAAKG